MINTELFDKAVRFAAKAHSGMERKGHGTPYLLHPLEAASICAVMTTDQEILAAAVLHDVMEDCEVTYEELVREFGTRVADLVKFESALPAGSSSMEDSWKDRKLSVIRRLETGNRDELILTLGDKLSNMRAIARDYRERGEALWQVFHNTDPAAHEWYYRSLAGALRKLEGLEPYEEFAGLVYDTFACRNSGASKPENAGEERIQAIRSYLEND